MRVRDDAGYVVVVKDGSNPWLLQGLTCVANAPGMCQAMGRLRLEVVYHIQLRKGKTNLGVLPCTFQVGLLSLVSRAITSGYSNGNINFADCLSSVAYSRILLKYALLIIVTVESKRGDGLDYYLHVSSHLLTMNIWRSQKTAKLGVRHGMWRTVNKLHSGFRAYQTVKNPDTAVLRCAMMARGTTKISSDEGAGILWSESLVKKIDVNRYPRPQKRWWPQLEMGC